MSEIHRTIQALFVLIGFCFAVGALKSCDIESQHLNHDLKMKNCVPKESVKQKERE